MATTATGLLVVRCPGITEQASKEVGICLGSLAGDNTNLVLFDFTKDGVYEDTVT